MIGNPEFTRNIWLHFTWPRVIAAAIVIGILYYAVSSFGSRGDAAIMQGGRWVYGFIIALWATRRAADALAEEVGANTWEVQRMSGLSAWQMAWGKLLGGTAFPWFCGLLCLGLMDITALSRGVAQSDLLYDNANLIITGLAAHAVSLSVALLLLRKAQLRRRLMVTFAQVCGLVVYLHVLAEDLVSLFGGNRTFTWYGHAYPATPFQLTSLIVFALWMWLGLYRLMRLELQYRNWPWAWIGFLAYTVIYLAGFADINEQSLAAKLAYPFGACVLLTYLSFLAEPKDAVRYRWGVRFFASGEIGKAISFIPLWLISYAATAALGIVVAVLAAGDTSTDLQQTWLLHWFLNRAGAGFRPEVLIIATLLFVLRDILFLLLLNFSNWRERADIAGLIYLLIAYFPFAWIIGFIGSYRLLPFVMPFDAGNMVMTYAPVSAEIIALAILVSRRWRLLVAIKPARGEAA